MGFHSFECFRCRDMSKKSGLVCFRCMTKYNIDSRMAACLEDLTVSRGECLECGEVKVGYIQSSHEDCVRYGHLLKPHTKEKRIETKFVCVACIEERKVFQHPKSEMSADVCSFCDKEFAGFECII